MENIDIDVLIEQLRQITRDNGNEKYADAQFRLGCLYADKKLDHDKAQACWLNITKEDDPEAYAKAQFNLGVFYLNIKHDYDQAEACWLNITKEDYPEAYANAQFGLGVFYLNIKHDYDQAETCWLNITKEDYPEAYAKAQFNLGVFYFNIKQDYDQAETCWLNITKEDYPEAYANAQLNLGALYKNIKHECDQAEACWLKITKKDDPGAYAKAQFNLGVLYKDIKQDYDQAETYWLKITKEDDPEAYANAQFSLANIYFFQKNDRSKAQDYYNKIKYCSSQSYIYITAKVILELMDINPSSNSIKENLKNLIFVNTKNICTLANDIKKTLLVSFNIDNSSNNDTEAKEPERRVAHYTKPAVLFNLLKGKNPSKFRLNIVDFMNDPSENQVLTNWLNITNNSDNEIKSFLASFSFNHNSLNQFRLYGNEDNILGSGVSIAFNKDFFCQDTERSISNEIALISNIKSLDNKQIKLETEQTEIESDDTLHPLPLYRCLYFDPKTEYMTLAKRNKQSFSLEMYDEENKTVGIDDKWQNYIDELKEKEKIEIISKRLKKIKELMSKLLNNKELQKIPNLKQLLSLTVLPISCLIKHAAFEDEDECRMIYITHIGDKKIVEPQDYQSTTSLYVEYTNVENYIDIIYLGPKCKAQHELWLQNHIRKDSCAKEIKLIKSEVPLR
ncbi:tetratricopeptide repeat protein [Snodgrassella alvi]|jgi:tetratricopeptide (TPR) repeat protein|uniref:Uncharacterized protein n=1 Tax=Snodgrassella alvi TaxID=1196083 RepID=A0A855FSM6_9NEIS|nr:tetratricopeptide repeat protein [Snodgrassella alvi]PIT58593.1 hypothetical protein BHC57_12205 [Snodgrassella alvi]